MELVQALDQTFQHAGKVIAGVQPGQLDDPTPCSEWTVRDLLGHMVGVVAGIGAAASGAGRDGAPFELSSDPAAQFRAAADANLAAWQAPGVMEKVIDGGPGPMPGQVLAGINLLDTATHTWDLATATGQAAALPDDVASAALGAARQIISPEIRPGRFAPEVVGHDLPTTTDELVAFLGRTP
jgi:uncharacterized protein (TIGR03086 family)